MGDILVRRHTIHGMPSRGLATTISERIPSWTVHHPTSPSEEQKLLEQAEIIVGSHFPDTLLTQTNRLRLFACTWAGVNHLDLQSLSDAGITVTNASGVHAPNIAEHVLGWFLMITRRLDEAQKRQEQRNWQHFQSMGELNGSRVAVIGLGSIGQAIVERLESFNVETIGIRYTPSKGGPTDEVYGFDQVPEVLGSADYVAIACPLSDETAGLIGKRELEIMRSNAILVNVGRGQIIDTDALVSALQGGEIHAAALDVTDPEPLPSSHPLWRLENCYISAHVSGHSPNHFDRFAEIIASNVTEVEETGEWSGLTNQVI